MKTKRMIALLTVVAFMLTMLNYGVLASTSDGCLTVVTGNIANNTVEVKVEFTNNPGIAGMNIRLNYDNTKLVPASCTKGTIFGGLPLSNVDKVTDGDYSEYSYITYLWSSTSNSFANGTVLTVLFNIIDSSFTSTELTVSYDSGDISNQNLVDVNPQTIKATLVQQTGCSYSINREGGKTTQNTSGTIATDSLTVVPSIKINGAVVEENEVGIFNNANMTCTLTVSNSATSTADITLILATYTATGKFYDVTVQKSEVEAGVTETIELTRIFNDKNVYSCKLMFWNLLSDMQPIREVIEMSRENAINTYSYDSDNRLIRIDKANGKSLIFTYDNMGNLLTKTVEG